MTNESEQAFKEGAHVQEGEMAKSEKGEIEMHALKTHVGWKKTKK